MSGLVVSFRQLGKFNIWSFFALRSYTELDDLLQRIKLHPHVLKINVGILVDFVDVDYPEKLEIEHEDSPVPTKRIINGHKSEEKIAPETTAKEPKKVDFTSAGEFDELDMSIICLLSKNARLSFRKIAAKVGLSTQAVIKRYDKIKEAIPFSSLTVNLEKLGYIGNVYFQIKVSNQHACSDVFNEILQIENAIIAFRTMGNYQIVAGLPFRSIDQLWESHHKINSIAGVIETEAVISKPTPSWPINIYSGLVSKSYEQLKQR